MYLIAVTYPHKNEMVNYLIPQIKIEKKQRYITSIKIRDAIET
jgi:predicted phosphatase